MGLVDELFIFRVITYGVQILSTLALLAAAGAAIYYAVQAKKQTEKTNILAEQTKTQAEATLEIAEQGKREYEPKAVARLNETPFNVHYTREALKGLLVTENAVAEVRIDFHNLSKGTTEFDIELTGRYDPPELESVDITADIIWSRYKKSRRVFLLSGEVLPSRFEIDLKKAIGIKILKTAEERTRMMIALVRGRLTVGLGLAINELNSYEHLDFVDYFFARLENRIVELPNKMLLIPGEWIFEGRDLMPVKARNAGPMPLRGTDEERAVG